jgi:hypothetical protein
MSVRMRMKQIIILIVRYFTNLAKEWEKDIMAQVWMCVVEYLGADLVLG